MRAFTDPQTRLIFFTQWLREEVIAALKKQIRINIYYVRKKFRHYFRSEFISLSPTVFHRCKRKKSTILTYPNTQIHGKPERISTSWLVIRPFRGFVWRPCLFVSYPVGISLSESLRSYVRRFSAENSAEQKRIKTIGTAR